MTIGARTGCPRSIRRHPAPIPSLRPPAPKPVGIHGADASAIARARVRPRRASLAGPHQSAAGRGASHWRPDRPDANMTSATAKRTPMASPHAATPEIRWENETWHVGLPVEDSDVLTRRTA